MTNQILGHMAHPSDPCEYLTLSFSPFSAPIRSRWRNNGVSADFLGDYVITFLPGSGRVASDHNEIKHAVTYIANELLENAMKYRETGVDIPIGLHMELTSDQITVSATNGAGFEQAQRYRDFVECILGGDAAELLVKQLEQGAANGGSNKSCLGLLTMINDFQVQLGCRFEVHAAYAQTVNVTTSVVLPLKNLSGVTA